MNHLPSFPTTTRRFLAVLAALVFFAWPGRAVEPSRWLLIFDTSSAMKKRLPAVETELKKIFNNSLDGHLKAGDDVAVWTFDQQTRSGQFPLATWQPANAPTLFTNLMTFLRKQKYSGETSLAALQPALGKVIDNSQRLTVIIFCDGQSEINWTPYNDGINQTLKQNFAERKKVNQPIVLLFRTQEGKFTACTVNFPPGGINLPQFPLLSEEIMARAPKPPTNPPVTPKPVVIPPPALIIVGKNVATNLAQIPPTVEINLRVATTTNTGVPLDVTPPMPATIAKPTQPNLPPALATPTTVPIVASNPIIANLSTNAHPATPTEVDPRYKLLVLLATGALFVAGTLVVLLVVRERRPRSSLITDSMNSPKNPPRKK